MGTAIMHKATLLGVVFGAIANIGLDLSSLEPRPQLVGTQSPQRVAPRRLDLGAPWKHIGPQPLVRETLLAGWITAVAVDPRDSNVAYFGAAGGGVWKTTDGGLHWQPLTDALPSLSIGAIVLDPSSPDIVYVGTGYLEHASPNLYYGVGIFKSSDGGQSWAHLPGPFEGPLNSEQGGANITSLAVHPTNGQIVLAAVRAGSTSTSGIYRSEDGGVTWTRVLSGGTGTAVTIARENGDLAYAAISLGGTASGVYRSTDAGQSWTRAGELGGTGLPAANVGLIALAVAPSNAKVLYAGIATATGTTDRLLGMFKSSDGGLSWIPLPNTPQYCGTACWRRNVVQVHPANPDIVFAGGRLAGNRLHRTLDGGNTWVEISRSIDGLELFSDLTGLAFSRDGAHLYVTNDGGVFRTTNSTAAAPLKWENLNATIDVTGLSRGMAMHPIDAGIVFAGPLEGGVARYTGQLAWQGGIICGDGGAILIDPQAPNTMYVACQPDQTALLKTTSGNLPRPGWVRAQTGIDLADRYAIFRPFVMDPTNPRRLYFGTFRVYQTNDGASSWTPISPDLAGGQATLSAIAVGTGNPNTIYVGTTGLSFRGPNPSPIAGNVFVTTNADAGAGATWTNRSAGLPPRSVTQIAVDPRDSLTAYAAFSGFSGFSGDTKGHLFKTSDGGLSWIDSSGGLPNVPIDDILVDDDLPDTIYLATDGGVFATTDGGRNWAPLSAGLPRAMVMGLKLHRPTRTLRAATYGRGMWELQVPK
jgi:photosystem II stability/assembly factor-like uncharacterized protein